MAIKSKKKANNQVTESAQPKVVVNEWKDVERAIDYLADHKIDVTKDENDRVQLAVCLFDMYGEDGLDPFLMISKVCKGYNLKEASDLYIQHSQRSYHGRKDFFALLTKYGIQVKDLKR